MAENSRVFDTDEPYVHLLPDYGHPSGLWSNRVPFPSDEVRPYLLASEFGLPEEFDARLTAWIDDFHAGFVTVREIHCRPLWREGWDPEAWGREGVEIARELSTLLPGYLIHYGGDKYTRIPTFVVPFTSVMFRDGVDLTCAAQLTPLPKGFFPSVESMRPLSSRRLVSEATTPGPCAWHGWARPC